MKPICSECTHYNKKKCVLDLKNTYQDCKKWQSIPMETYIREKNKLLVTGDNPVRLKELVDRIDYFFYGIKNK